MIGTEGSRKFHFFKCAAGRCKVKGGGVRRYQDSKDRAATSNLKSHATKCFGADAVDAAFKKTTSGPGARDGSIFASFARLGQSSVTISHRAHTTDESRFVIYFTVVLFSVNFLTCMMLHPGPTLLGGVLRATGQ
jgi:hypothetical protein